MVMLSPYCHCQVAKVSADKAEKSFPPHLSLRVISTFVRQRQTLTNIVPAKNPIRNRRRGPTPGGGHHDALFLRRS